MINIKYRYHKCVAEPGWQWMCCENINCVIQLQYVFMGPLCGGLGSMVKNYFYF